MIIVNEISYQDNLITKFLIKSSKHGKFEVIIDTEDWNKIKTKHWSISYRKQPNLFYIVTYNTYLHRFILDERNPKIHVDHINHNTFDNKKSNLRQCSCKENIRNQKIHRNNVSKYKGVHWDNYHKKWRAAIMKNYKFIFLGYFKNPIDAAIIYNKKAKELFGKFAYMNEVKNESTLV